MRLSMQYRNILDNMIKSQKIDPKEIVKIVALLDDIVYIHDCFAKPTNNTGAEISFLSQVRQRLDEYKDSIVPFSKMKDILLGASIVAIKEYNDEVQIPNFHFLRELYPNPAAYVFAEYRAINLKKNKFYVRMQGDALQYAVINPQGRAITDKIEKSELENILSPNKLDILQPFDLEKLRPFATKILDSASKRAHVYPNSQDHSLTLKQLNKIEREHLAAIDFNTIISLSDLTHLEKFINIDKDTFIKFELATIAANLDITCDEIKIRIEAIKDNIKNKTYPKETLKKANLTTVNFKNNNTMMRLELPTGIADIFKVIHSDKLSDEEKLKKVIKLSKQYQAMEFIPMKHLPELDDPTLTLRGFSKEIDASSKTLYNQCLESQQSLNDYYKTIINNMLEIVTYFASILNNEIKSDQLKLLNLIESKYQDNGKDITVLLPAGIAQMLTVLYSNKLTDEQKLNEIVKISKIHHKIHQKDKLIGKNNNKLNAANNIITEFSNMIYKLSFYLTSLKGFEERPTAALPIFDREKLIPKTTNELIYKTVNIPPLKTKLEEENEEKKQFSEKANKKSRSTMRQGHMASAHINNTSQFFSNFDTILLNNKKRTSSEGRLIPIANKNDKHQPKTKSTGSFVDNDHKIKPKK